MKFKNYLNVNEVLGYKLKTKDRKLIQAFIDGDKDGEGNALYIDDPGNGTTELKGGMAGVLATRDGKGYITIGRAYGNVSQTWINAIRKMTPKFWLKEDINEGKSWVDAAKQVVKKHQMVYINPKNNDISDEKKNGYTILDATTANMLVQIADALSSTSKEKFTNMNLTQAVNIGWKLVSK